MPDIAFLKILYSHTLKDLERVDQHVRPLLEAQAARLSEQIRIAQPPKAKKKTKARRSK